MENKHKKIVEAYIRHYNKFEIEEMLSCLSDDCIFENVSNAGNSVECKGKEEIRGLATKSAQLFSQREQSVNNWIISENKIAVEIGYAATLATDLSETLKAGHKLDLRGVSIFEFKGEKISRIADYS